MTPPPWRGVVDRAGDQRWWTAIARRPLSASDFGAEQAEQILRVDGQVVQPVAGAGGTWAVQSCTFGDLRGQRLETCSNSNGIVNTRPA